MQQTLITKSKKNDDVEHLPGDEEEDKKKDCEEGDKVVCLIVEQITHNLPRHLLHIVQFWHLKSKRINLSD